MPAQGYRQNAGGRRPKRSIYINQNLFRTIIERTPGHTNEGCKLCNFPFTSKEVKEQHLKEETHIVKNLYHSNRKEITKTIEGLRFKVIDDQGKEFNDYNEGRLNVTLRESKQNKFRLLLINQSPNLFEVNKFFKIFALDNIQLSQADKNLHLQLLPGGEVEINMLVLLQRLGAYLIPLMFKLKIGNEEKEEENNYKFLLVEVIFRAQTQLMDLLAPKEPYKPLLRNIIKEMEEPVIRFTGKRSLDRTRRYLGHIKFDKNYEVPGKLKKTMSKVKTYKDSTTLPSSDKTYWDEIINLLNAPLTSENYKDRFCLLLHLEELQAEYEMLQYGQNGVTMVKTGSLCELMVPGLAEERPSLLIGDSVYVRIQKHNEYRYEGLIKEVRIESVLIDFGYRFINLYENGMKVDIRFSLNRLPLKFCHRAIELLHKSGAKSLMFPSEEDSYPTLSRPLKPWRFQKIENNHEQQEAVRQIVNKSAMPAPYLLFGPPGTGKTVTLVEAIAQVWLLNESNPEKQLVCAPTNSTADLITVGLLKAIPKAKILRIYAMSFNIKLKNEGIPFKCTNITGGVVAPVDGEKLSNFHIIVMTLITAGRMQGIEEDYFSYVYVDECGQAREPEAWIPVAGIITSKKRKGNVSGQLVLAGDPEQLGPVLHSTLAKKHGLELSLLERFMKHNSLYKRNPLTNQYNSKYLTKLIQNFRSHEHILTYPNDVFYEGELQVKGDSSVIMRGIGWEQLRNKNFPVIFHGIEGIDERECHSPSYFNRQEIDQVIKYMEILLKDGLGGRPINESDIGVISPYRKQVQKFREAFNVLKWENVKVGTTEQFQGDERLVIIISTVRSSQDQVKNDLRFKLGFLENPKRFNVAVTRAKALLIMVGNPHILCHDPYWLGFMKFVRDNGGTTGVQWREVATPNSLLL